MAITLSQWPQRRRPNTTGSRTAPQPFVTDSQWNLIKHLFENPDPSPKGGRPRVDPRECLEGIIFVLRTGSQWQYLPDRYSPLLQEYTMLFCCEQAVNGGEKPWRSAGEKGRILNLLGSCDEIGGDVSCLRE